MLRGLVARLESLRVNALETEIHLEAILPLQTASIAFEVGKLIVDRKKKADYTYNFANKIVKTLENSCLNVCFP